MRDIELRAKVLAELEYDPSVDAANIGVAVKEGVVTLTGHVANYSEKIAAERAVRRVKGVRAIAEEIEIRLPRQKKPRMTKSPAVSPTSCAGTVRFPRRPSRSRFRTAGSRSTAPSIGSTRE